MLGTHLNIATFYYEPTIDCKKFETIKKNIFELDTKCEQFEGKHLYNTDYKAARVALGTLYYNFIIYCDDDANRRNILDLLKQNIVKTNELNTEKKRKLDNLNKIINDQNKKIASIDEEIEKNKNYDSVKKHRIIGSETLRKRSFVEYYIYIVLIIVFVIIQIILLVL